MGLGIALRYCEKFGYGASARPGVPGAWVSTLRAEYPSPFRVEGLEFRV